jgi:hypothetical protein
MADKTTYVFIDGSYVLEAVDRAMKSVFGVPGDLAPEGRPASLLEVSDQEPLILRVEMPDGVHWFEHNDQQVLDRFFSMLYGPIDWSEHGVGSTK